MAVYQAHRVIVLREQGGEPPPSFLQKITDPVGACSRRQWCKQRIKRGKHTQEQVGSQAASYAFDLGRPVKPRWPEFDVEAWGKPAGMPV